MLRWFLLGIARGGLLLSSERSFLTREATWQDVVTNVSSIVEGADSSSQVVSFVHPLTKLEGIPLTTECESLECVVRKLVDASMERVVGSKRQLSVSDCDATLAQEVLSLQHRGAIQEISGSTPFVAVYTPLAAVQCYLRAGQEEEAKAAAQDILKKTERFLKETRPDAHHLVVRLDEKMLIEAPLTEGFDLYYKQQPTVTVEDFESATEEDFESAAVRRLQAVLPNAPPPQLTAIQALNQQPAPAAATDVSDAERFSWNIRVMTALALTVLIYVTFGGMATMELPRDNLLYTKMSAAA
ncbi:MAG: uncharacterized protein KVP18_003263 [Porospora cf. gigantea A]|uniref:uncharacterized protein n=1 Tax=Porospora cf. gigantea A TaxID=2853593 RepID=UPI003559F6EE|nr:MAG: hypothetical protein KVP18_003263 [Porospora cf. gigantea A]